ncbi:3'-5' exonuclease [Massilia sp. CFBP9012]|uniref:3'-5' exonuclease n=1 Tax=Massilia sp. CFBP9012 TaxID=3096531 RepID=UPI002A6B787F|nr:3'-5' exonuclease [Massilia sp. CFBP9012]MDY0976468.1 3'-5' exonuclease [Massilia sp. CFBP9012]
MRENRRAPVQLYSREQTCSVGKRLGRATQLRLVCARYLLPSTGNPIVFFDFETTGLSAKTDLIIEVAAVKCVPGAKSHPHMQQLILIEKPLSPFISRLTGITNDMPHREERQMEVVLDEFIEFISDHDVLSFNVNFDTEFLNAALFRHGRRPLKNIGHCALAPGSGSLAEFTKP